MLYRVYTSTDEYRSFLTETTARSYHARLQSQWKFSIFVVVTGTSYSVESSWLNDVATFNESQFESLLKSL